MPEPLFQLLDVVVITPSHQARTEDILGTRAIVTQVRHYADGRYRYAVAAADHDEANGIWDEADLRPTGDKGSLELFQSPGRLRMRDVVVVEPADKEHAHLAGARG